jgi:hypothetical protein
MLLTASRVAGQVIAPTVVAYVAFLLALWTGFRTPSPRTSTSPPPARLTDWARLVRLLATTALGGFAVFLGLILIFYFALGGQGPGFVADAFGSGAMLALAVVVPAFLTMEAGRAALHRIRRARRSSGAD